MDKPIIEFEQGCGDRVRHCLEQYGVALVRNAIPAQKVDVYFDRLEQLSDRLVPMSTEELAALPELEGHNADFERANILGGHIGDWVFSKFYPELSFTDLPSKFFMACLPSIAPGLSFMGSNVHTRRIATQLVGAGWSSPITFHVDAQFHSQEFIQADGQPHSKPFVFNFWVPFNTCGETAPSMEIVLANMSDVRDFLGVDLKGSAPFGLDSHGIDHQRIIDRFGSDAFWAPPINKGDTLVITNWTLHRTHITAAMSEPRTSVEVRLCVPSTDFPTSKSSSLVESRI